MQDSRRELFALEKKFWQSMVDTDTDTAIDLLCEPAFMVSSHGSMKFDHAGYRKMAEQGTMVIKSFELSDMEATFPNDGTAVLSYKVHQTLSSRGKSEKVEQHMTDTSTWVRDGDAWRCVMHTEAPAPTGKAKGE
ncbi:nuclear transport factor 2 family protein [Variovorax sp. ZT5P49]|uniref:nuclear transport factor 2 family protein n=1 Tax=Variovorax sp. ZT5P49 TaxID=3443733 RepID=UPI003F47D28A